MPPATTPQCGQRTISGQIWPDSQGRFRLVCGEVRGYIGTMQATHSPATLDAQTCRRARLSRDSRFDGEFYTAVRTTGIYCRPVCPARPPAEKNVTYYRSAAEAADAGYRPCLRCRPESAPGSPAWLGSSTTVKRAVSLIQAGALNDGPVSSLATRLGVGERYLRKLFTREIGVSPQAMANNQRLLFARKLLAETRLPITEVAYASGFGSVRRFNSAVRTQFRQTPGDLRKRSARSDAGAALQLVLHYRPPYDWDGVINFFMRHAVDGVETAAPDGYRRNLRFGHEEGWITVTPVKDKPALLLGMQLPDNALLMTTVANVRRMFDLDANPAAIQDALSRDPELAQLVKRYPGIRSPGYWSPFEACVRAIVGQQVSTSAARSVLSRLAAACKPPGAMDTPFASPAALANLPDAAFPMPGRRRDTLRELCRSVVGHENELDIPALARRRGIGPWTVAMAAMRGAAEPDALPANDLGLKQAWAALGQEDDLASLAVSWQPWRSYAANLLWRSLGT